MIWFARNSPANYYIKFSVHVMQLFRSYADAWQNEPDCLSPAKKKEEKNIFNQIFSLV